MNQSADVEWEYPSRAEDLSVFLYEPVRPSIRHKHYSRCDIWFTLLVSMGGADDTPQAAWKIGWPWEAALYSGLMTWSDLKDFD